ncbi:MAG: tol-pal system protein YbgF [Methylotetracoccus sp.]|jgi:tol-pal system protein YbgF|nr:tol-pal system protein YbgF [Methylotetracoccus sp.]
MRETLCRLSVSLLLAAPTAAVLAAPYDDTYDQAAGYGVETLENRVQRLEKKFSGQAMAKMVGDVEKLQSEVLKLRGEVEKAQNELERLRKQHKEDYGNVDQRLQQVITNQSVMQAQLQAAAPPAPPAPAVPVEGGEQAAAPVTDNAAQSPLPAAAPVESAPPPPREVAYQKAFTTLKDGKYSDAIKEFKSFMAAYPNGEFSDNAQYWLAEAYYVTKDYGAARIAFEQVVKAFPQSAKVADAMLKVGFIDYDRGQYAEARTALADVVKRYPGSSAAKLAEKRLERMQQEGR